MGFGKDGKGAILWDQTQILPGALIPADVAGAATNQNLIEDFRILRTDYWINYLPVATDGFEGPVLVGMAPGGLSAAEVEEAIDSVPTYPGDAPASERSLRPVWPLEAFVFLVDNAQGWGGHGELVKKGSFNPKWTFHDSDEWIWWVFNFSGNTLTTGGQVNIVAKHFGVWLT